MTAPDSDGELSELCPGDVLAARYELLEPLAVGGMGRVWLARNLATGAEVAAKVLLTHHAASPDALARFRREAEATARLAHRGIVRIFDLIELDPPRSSLVMIMELLRGRTLAHHIRHAGPLSVSETLEVALPLLSALSHAHGLGIVHRDLKPENIFLALEPDGCRVPKIVDFGIAKELRAPPITRDGQIMGTPLYMSPEQTLGQTVDARSDIFSFGILLYECLSGTNPFARSLPLTEEATPSGLMAVFALEPRPLAGVPPALWRVIERALAKNAEARFASVADLAEALYRATPWCCPAPDPRSSIFPLPPPLEPSKSRATSRLSHRIAVSVFLASIAVVAVVSPTASSSARDHRPRRQVDSSLPHEKRVTTILDLIRSSAPSELGEMDSAHESSPHSASRLVGRDRRPGMTILAAANQFRRRRLAQTLLASRSATGILRDPGF